MQQAPTISDTPPPETIQSLLALVQIGDLRGLLDEITTMEKSPELIPFCNQVSELAQTCQIEAIEQFLTSLL